MAAVRKKKGRGKIRCGNKTVTLTDDYGVRKSRNKPDLEARRLQTARLYCQGKSMAEIAKTFDVSIKTVSLDMRVVREDWRKAANEELKVWASQELAKLDHIEFAAWEGWGRSIGIHTRTTVETVVSERGEGQKQIVVDDPLAGDPRFLDVILRCVQRRCAILGLDAPEKIQDVTPKQPVEILIETREDAITVRELLNDRSRETERN